MRFPPEKYDKVLFYLNNACTTALKSLGYSWSTKGPQGLLGGFWVYKHSLLFCLDLSLGNEELERGKLVPFGKSAALWFNPETKEHHSVCGFSLFTDTGVTSGGRGFNPRPIGTSAETTMQRKKQNMM